MIEIQCPRCHQYWYSREHVTGRARICEGCALRDPRKPRRGITKELGVFAIVAAGLLVVDGVWLILTACWPHVFGLPMLIYGCVLGIPGGFWFVVTLRLMGRGWEIDWTIHKWPMLIAIVGLVCVGAYFAVVHGR